MTSIQTSGIRHDIEHLLERSEILTGADLDHHPFLVLYEIGEEEPGTDGPLTVVVQVRTIDDLLAYPDETVLLWQWPGKWRSDFFQLTVGVFRQAYTLKQLEVPR